MTGINNIVHIKLDNMQKVPTIRIVLTFSQRSSNKCLNLYFFSQAYPK